MGNQQSDYVFFHPTSGHVTLALTLIRTYMQVIPKDIEWIVKRAKQRKYFQPSTFMSSKPDAGINHKVYGVTSEGIAVFLHVALGKIGIDPSKDSFTIKLTGGTDGDVAGNMIKILNRDYGPRAKIVGLADGTGCIEDPNGLSHEELLRLFHNSLPISSFDPAVLSADGKFYTTENEEGIRARNTVRRRRSSSSMAHVVCV